MMVWGQMMATWVFHMVFLPELVNGTKLWLSLLS